jgi:hypothetical protein
MADLPASGHWVLIDAHAHIHGCFDRTGFLDAAHRNLDAAAARRGLGPAFDGVLALTECAHDDAFGELWAVAGSTTPLWGGWSVERRTDGISLRATRGPRTLILVAGRQVAAREDLEVLMLGTARRMADGAGISDILRQAREWGAVRVIPWGAGKWFFARGRLLSSIMQHADQTDFFLGDEGGRPVFWPEPRHFSAARRLGLRILPGTDPLPFPSETARAGSFGAAFRGKLDPDRPGESLLAALRDPATVLTPFGALESPLRFVRHQVGMQLRKRRRVRAAAGA